MPLTIFFSWQSDTSADEGRDLIEKALEGAAKRISQDITIEEAARDVRIDKDTKNVPGQPAVVDTIFKKIDGAALFVPDLTFVGTRRDGRPTPNPNVMIEYGWALKSLGNERIVPVMNTAHGEPDGQTMPFDMRHLRHPKVLYDCPDGASEDMLAQCLANLTDQFEQEIRLLLNSDEFKNSLPKAPAFPAVEPKDGPGKFRVKGQPIGINHSRSFWANNESYDLHLNDGPAMWLRVLPTVSNRRFLITDLEEAIRQDRLYATLSGHAHGYAYVRGEDGFGVYEVSGENGLTGGVVYIFTTGEMWAVDSYMLQAQKHFNATPNVELTFALVLAQCAKFMHEKLKIQTPYKWMAGMEDLKGRGLIVPIQPGYGRISHDPQGKCIPNIVSDEGVFLPEKMSVQEALRPFFIKLYDAHGVSRPAFLDTQAA